MTKLLRFVIVPILAITLQQTATSQSLSVNTTGAVANTSSILDVSSTTKGVLIPRMDKTQKNAIATPANGLLIYQTLPDSLGFHYYDGTQWVWLSGTSDSTAWKLTGNSNITSGSFLGTTTDTALRFRIRNTASGIIDSASENTALGYKNLQIISPGIKSNTAIGYMSGKNLTSGSNNTLIGRNVLSRTGISLQNIGIGDSALSQAISVGNLIGIGFQALKLHDGQGFYTDNLAIGTYSQRDSSFGGSAFWNTSVGGYSLQSNRLGSGNTAVGLAAMQSHRVGANNTAMGLEAMQFDSAGSLNVAVGWRALRNNKTGTENTAVGVGALEADSSGNYNTAVGRYASFLNKRGDFNVSMGFQASNNADTATNTVAIGSYAMSFNKQDNNVVVGYAAGYTAGSQTGFNPKEITFVGMEAGRGAWASNKNTAVGFRALSNTDAGFGIWDYVIGRNTAIGDSAMAFSIGGRNVVVGTEALSNTGTSGTWNNVAIGDSSMGAAQSNGGALFDNVAIGFKSGTQLRNHGNVVMGSYAGQKLANTIWNTAIGYHALEADTTGSENTVIGTSAFRSNANGIRNVSVGINTGYWVTSSNNTYLGSYAGQGVNGRSTGGSNTAVGNFALYQIRTGTQNVAIGESALGSDSTGSRNISVGAGSMDQKLRGDDNVAIGFWANRNDTAGTNTVAIGRDAAYNNQRDATVAIGFQALYNNSVGLNIGTQLDSALYNTAVGYQASAANTKGGWNTAVGYLANRNNTTGFFNTAVGIQSLFSNTTGNANTALGTNAMFSTGAANTNSTAVGAGAMQYATGIQNTALGAFALGGSGITTGGNNVGIGVNALTTATSADNNIAIGTFSLDANTTGDDNIAIGVNALTTNISGANNVAMGTSALVLTTANNNTAIGSFAGDINTTGTNNTFLGFNAEVTVNNLTNATAIGANATVAQSNSLVLGNTSVAVGVGLNAPLTKFHIYDPASVNVNLRVASFNTSFEPGLELIKTGAGSDWKIRTTTAGTLVYARSGDDFATSTDYYQMAIGSFIPVNDASNTLGGAANRWTTVYATVGAINTSDARDKENITNLNYGLSEIMKLRPVSFNWKENPQWGKKIGFIAQEVQSVLGEVVQVGSLKTKAEEKNDDAKNKKADTDKLGIYYSDIIPVTVKAIQEQQQTIQTQQKQIDDLKKKNEQLEKDMQAIKAKLGINN